MFAQYHMNAVEHDMEEDVLDAASQGGRQKAAVVDLCRAAAVG